MLDIIDVIATDLKLDRNKVEAIITLIKEGYGVPFIVRYRKAKTGGLDESQVRAISDRYRECSELEARRAQALKAIADSSKLTPELQKNIESVSTRAELEDWYMAFRSRRRTRSAAARQKGLEPLADLIWKQELTAGNVEEIVKPFITGCTDANCNTGASITSEASIVATTHETSAVPKVENVDSSAQSDLSKTIESTTATSSDTTGAKIETKDVAGKQVKDMTEALSGARDILAERVAEHAAVRKIVRDLLVSQGKVIAKARDGVDLSRGKFSGYANFTESLTKIPAHRILAVMRGASEKQLSVVIEAPKEETLAKIKEKLVTNTDSVLKPELLLAIEEAYERLLAPSMDNELRLELKHSADIEAVDVFAKNLRALLLQAPLGPKPVIGIEPGLRSGCKIAVLDSNGKVISCTTIHLYPKGKDATVDAKAVAVEAAVPSAVSEGVEGTPSQDQSSQPNSDVPEGSTTAPGTGTEGTDLAVRNQAADTLVKLIRDHEIKAVAIGNGSGSRETDVFVRDVLKNAELKDVLRTVVNESGASIYSASSVAREELPALDGPSRNAVFIGRRLQNPLAELVKLDPKAIGVGQYQHDVDQSLLKQKLDDVIESCVNQVGVDVNTAGASLLRFVCGLNPVLAKVIVETRTAKGTFKSREELKTIQDLTPKQFDQCVGFLRVSGSSPLDSLNIHPEHYAVIEKMATGSNLSIGALLGNSEALDKLQLDTLKTEEYDEATLKALVEELKNPAKDPRSQFVLPEFNEDVREVSDLVEGMVLNGVISNLTAFGAFVDIGVHQDGLVHISALTYKFIRDPSEVVAVGQRVKVKVLSVDKERKRISLSMKALQAQSQRRPTRAPRTQTSPTGGVSSTTSTEIRSSGSVQGGQRPQNRGPRSQSQQQPQRGPRTDRGPRPSQTAAGATPAGSSVGASTPSSASAVAGGRPERGDRHGSSSQSGRPQGQGQGGQGRGRRDESSRGAPASQVQAPQPGKPDYSKFFVKSKRKEKERRVQDNGGASRDEVRQAIRTQEGRGTTLGDLLRKAGVVSDEK